MIPNYKESAIGWSGLSDIVIVSVYNDTGSDIAIGVPQILVTKWVSGSGVYMAPLAVATNTAVANIVGVPLVAHVNATWQPYIVKGLAEYCVTSGSLAANDNVQVINSGVSFIDEGTNGGAVETSDAVGVAVEEVTTNVWKIYLRGKQVSVAAS